MKTLKQLIAQLSPARFARTEHSPGQERRRRGEAQPRWPRDERLWRELAA